MGSEMCIRDSDKADTAVFYSISATQPGLDGVGFGSFLIKRVVDRLCRDHKQLKHFATLSPLPGFKRWLTEKHERPGDQQHPRVQKGLEVLADAGALERMFVDRSWLRDEAALAKVSQPLTILAAHYLMREKYGDCLLYTSPSPRDLSTSRMPSSA